MTSQRTRRPEATPAASTPGSEIRGGARIEMRKARRLTLASEEANPFFFVDRGCLTLDADVGVDRRQVLLLLYPGDIIARAAAPPLTQIGLTAVTPAVVTRVRLTNPDVVCSVCGLLPETLPARLARLSARLGLHSLALGRLNGEERLATLLVEMSIHLGAPTPAGISIPLPLSRGDMADYLALNPDTLSRLFTRLKSRGLIATPTRSLVTIHDLAAVKRLTPLAAALSQMGP